MTRAARSSFRTRFGIGLAAAGAATVLLMGAKPAAAAVVTSTIAVPGTSVISLTATCPKGQRATGAGWESTTRVPNQVQILPQESRKVGQRGWILTVARDDSMPASATTSLILYCLPWAPKTREVVALTSSPDDYAAFDTADAVCPPGRTVQSGGFSIPVNQTFDPFAELIESYRLAEGTWRARMEGNPGAQLASYAYCAKRKAPTEEFGSLQVAANNPVNFSAAPPPCGKKRKAIAGGLSQPDAVSTPTEARWVYGIYQFLRSGKSWEIAGTHFGEPNTLNAYVYCAKKPETEK